MTMATSAAQQEAKKDPPGPMMASPSTASDQRPAEQHQLNMETEINTAAAILSIAGPCRALGDVYLTCVAIAGLGECRHLRATFEQCAKASQESSRGYLDMIGSQWCEDKDDKVFCAAQMVNQQLMMQAYEPKQNE
mmetsp:Transcript_426/g.586  ORF Transcript_426/g.586 Transcript_426/m.586 type:complete len:136 (-) Transcript_426:413-820(-)